MARKEHNVAETFAGGGKKTKKQNGASSRERHKGSLRDQYGLLFFVFFFLESF